MFARVSNTRPDPAVRSLTVDETRISFRPATAANARPDIDGNPAHLVVDRLDLASVYAGSNIEPERADSPEDRPCATYRTSRPVEGGEEPVPAVSTWVPL